VSVNPVDFKTRQTDTQAPRVLGWDAAGTVEALGAECSLFKKGDAVYYAGDITRPGSNSEFQLVDERIVGRKPKSLDFAQAAAIPLTAITAWEAFFDRLQVVKERSMLIIGGAGGVGSIGIQLAKIAQLKVIATASRPETIAWCKELGADDTIDHRKPMRPQLEALGLKNVDYIANFSDVEEHWSTIGDLIAPQGGIVLIVGNKGPLNVDAVRVKSAAIHFELMFTRSRFKTPDMIEQHKLLNQVADWLDAGKLKGTLKQTFSPINAANLRKAHAQLESGSTIGKLVLQGWK
jgi:zinc-binding alcohol dehydrogenase family protein